MTGVTRGSGTEGGEEGKGEGEEERARGRRGKIVADGKGSKALKEVLADLKRHQNVDGRTWSSCNWTGFVPDFRLSHILRTDWGT